MVILLQLPSVQRWRAQLLCWNLFYSLPMVDIACMPNLKRTPIFRCKYWNSEFTAHINTICLLTLKAILMGRLRSVETASWESIFAFVLPDPDPPRLLSARFDTMFCFWLKSFFVKEPSLSEGRKLPVPSNKAKMANQSVPGIFASKQDFPLQETAAPQRALGREVLVYKEVVGWEAC